jgi:hypothetical protein
MNPTALAAREEDGRAEQWNVPSLGQAKARLGPSEAIRAMRCARYRSRVNWLSISSTSTFSRSLAAFFCQASGSIPGIERSSI